jgi:hypothetical protein
MIDLTKKYRTRGGKSVELISNKGRGNYPTIGYIDKNLFITSWTMEGVVIEGTADTRDLVEVKERKLWVNVYIDISGTPCSCIFETEADAITYQDRCDRPIKIIEIEYEV